MVMIAPAQDSDIPGIQQVALASWRATYQDIFAPDFIAQFIARYYSADDLRGSIDRDDGLFVVAKAANRVIGLGHAGVRQTGAQLFRLYVLPEFWRAGIGGQMLQQIEAQLVEQGTSQYFCYVHSRNEVGKAFYVKRRFKHDATRDQDDEWCMVKHLKVTD